MGHFDIAGLSDFEVLSSKRKYGTNELPSKESETFKEKLIENLKDPLVKILIIALCISLILTLYGYAEWIESIGIAASIFIATFVSTYSEHKNEETFKKLQERSMRTSCNVFR